MYRAIQRGPCLILAGVFPPEAFGASFPAQPMVEMTQISDFTFGGPLHWAIIVGRESAFP
jgi:hypothetical protein